jgi:hypothetical protein
MLIMQTTNSMIRSILAAAMSIVVAISGCGCSDKAAVPPSQSTALTAAPALVQPSAEKYVGISSTMDIFQSDIDGPPPREPFVVFKGDVVLLQLAGPPLPSPEAVAVVDERSGLEFLAPVHSDAPLAVLRDRPQFYAVGGNRSFLQVFLRVTEAAEISRITKLTLRIKYANRLGFQEDKTKDVPLKFEVKVQAAPR